MQDFLQQFSVNILQKTINRFIMVHMFRNDCTVWTDIIRVIFVYKLPLQPVILGLGLGLKTKFFGLGFEAQVIGLAVWPWPCILWPC